MPCHRRRSPSLNPPARTNLGIPAACGDFCADEVDSMDCSHSRTRMPCHHSSSERISGPSPRSASGPHRIPPKPHHGQVIALWPCSCVSCTSGTSSISRLTSFGAPRTRTRSNPQPSVRHCVIRLCANRGYSQGPSTPEISSSPAHFSSTPVYPHPTCTHVYEISGESANHPQNHTTYCY